MHIRKSTATHEWEALTVILRDARESAGVSQSEVARRLGKGQSYVWKVETGHRGLDVLEFIEYLNAVGAEPSGVFSEVEQLLDVRPKDPQALVYIESLRSERHKEYATAYALWRRGGGRRPKNPKRIEADSASITGISALAIRGTLNDFYPEGRRTP